MSQEKTIEVCEIEHISELTSIDQAVVDAVYRHNGKAPPTSPARLRVPKSATAMPTISQDQRKSYLNSVDPDCGYEQWLQVAMALSHETGNGEDGYRDFDEWSSRGSKYQGPEDTRATWRSLANPPENPITIATLIKMAKDAGHTINSETGKYQSPFKKVGFSVENPDTTLQPEPRNEAAVLPLARYSLTGCSGELEKRRQDEVFVLADIALLGQSTAIYAAPNSGKTLGVISLLSDSISEGRIRGEQVYYVNTDDNLRGLAEKTKIAEAYGFHMIGDGYRDFRAPMLFPILEAMICDDTALGSILIIDTAKRFTDLMSKREASKFTGLVRRFVARGGTVIALAHVNKKKTDSGKSVYAGTSDIIDDFDCAYVIELIDDGAISGKRVITFENRKARGSVAREAHFTYLVPDCVSSYQELLDSFCRIDAEQVDQAAIEAQRQADAPVIQLVCTAIQEGPAAKKDLIALLREKAQISRNSAASLIERYCGDIPGKHLWTFERGERGVHRYRLLLSTHLEGKS